MQHVGCRRQRRKAAGWCSIEMRYRTRRRSWLLVWQEGRNRGRDCAGTLGKRVQFLDRAVDEAAVTCLEVHRNRAHAHHGVVHGEGRQIHFLSGSGRRGALYARSGGLLVTRRGNRLVGSRGGGRRPARRVAGGQAARVPLRGSRRPGMRLRRGGAWGSPQDGGRAGRGTPGYLLPGGRHVASIPAVQHFARSVHTPSATWRRRDDG